MSFKHFKVMSFDVAGTLIDSERGMLDYLRQNVPGTTVSDEAFLEAYRDSRARDGAGRYPDDLIHVWSDIAKTLGLPDTSALAKGFRDSVAECPAFDDSVDALKRLHSRFYLVAMTNTQRWALDFFVRTLGQPFDDTVSFDDALCEKPDPQFFAFTRGRLSTRGFTLADTLHVAQSQYHDIGIARRLGYTVCWIERRHGRPGFGSSRTVEQLTKPDYHFYTLSQLADAADAAFEG
jgi:putative hydrolase of the HAD superfamily